LFFHYKYNQLKIRYLSKKKYFIIALICGLGACLGACSSPKEREALRFKVKSDSLKARLFEIKQKKLDLIFNHLAEKKLFNGNVLVAQDDKFLLKKCFGFANFAEKKPLQFNTAFRIGGLTQIFTALAIRQLIAAQKINETDSLKKFFPEMPFASVKIQHLLNHTSGIPDYLTYFYNTSTRELPYANNQNVLDWLINSQPDAEFIAGEQWAYSSTNYVLLASIVEQVSGQKFANYLKINLLEPLKLQDAFLPAYNQTTTHPRRAWGYSGIEGKLLEDHALNYIYGDSGLYASLEDLYRLLQALENYKLLKIKPLDWLKQTSPLASGQSYPFGLGWHIRPEKKAMYQQGSWLGFQAAVVRIPTEQTVIVILSNCQNPVFGQIAEMTQNLMLNQAYQIPQ
jgi:CubicO group peptidase (beta-lactamase class C family)